MRKLLRRVKSATALLAVSLGALALPICPANADLIVPPAQTTYSGCGISGTVTVSGLASATGSCDGGNGSAGTVTMQSFLAGDGSPIAETTVNGAAGPNGGFLPGATTILQYSIGLNQIAPLPFTPSAIPVDFVAAINAIGGPGVADVTSSISGLTNVSGSVSIHFDTGAQSGVTLDEQLATLPTQLMFALGEGPAIVDITLTAICGLDLLAGTSGKVTCSADPLVGFDQAAFDAQFGSRSFPLANYFDFVFSDGLAPPSPGPTSVPEPSSLAQLLTAIAAVISVRHFRSGRPRNPNRTRSVTETTLYTALSRID